MFTRPRTCDRRGGLLVAATMAVLAVLTPTPTPAGSPADFEGGWVRNEDLSDDPIAVMQEALDRKRLRVSRVEDDPGNSLGVGGVGIGGGFPSTGPRAGRLFDPETIIARMENTAQGIETLRVRYEHPMMSVRRADGSVRTLRVDGKRLVTETVDGKVSVRGRWKKNSDHLEVSSIADWGQDIVTTWRILPESGQLDLHTVLRPVAGLPKVEFRLIYDRPDEPGEDTNTSDDP